MNIKLSPTSFFYRIAAAIMIVMTALAALPMKAAYATPILPPQKAPATEAAIATATAWTNVYHSITLPGATAASFSVGAGTNRMLVVALSYEANSSAALTATSVTYGGTAMTAASANDSVTSLSMHSLIYYLIDTPSVMNGSNQTLAVNITGGGAAVMQNIWYAVFTGVSQSATPTAQNFNSGTGTVTAPAFVTGLTVNAGDQAVLVATATRATVAVTYTAPTNFNPVGNNQPNGITGLGLVASRNTTGAGTDTAAFSSVTGGPRWSQTGIVLAAAPTFTSLTTGNWNATGTWVGGVVPTAGANVVIAAGHTVTVTAPVTNAVADLTINSTGQLIVGGFNITVNGNTSVSGTLTHNTIAGTKAYNGNVIINSGGLWNETAATPITFGGNLQNDGTFTSSTGVHTFSGAADTISGTSAISIPSVAVIGTYTNDGTLTVATALSGAGGLTNGATGTLNLGGTSTITTLTATAVGNTVNYTGTGQTLKVTAYHHLTLSGGAETFGAITTVAGNLTLSGTATATTAAALAVGGNLVVGSGTTFATGLTNTWTLSVGGTTTVDGTLTLANTGAKTFTSTTTVNNGGTLNISGASTGIAFNNAVTINGTWNETAAAVVTFANNLTNNATSFTASTGLHTFSGAAMTISGSTTTSIASVAVTGTRTNNSTLTVGTALSGAGSLTNSSSGTLNIGGTSSITTLANAGTSTITGAGAISTALANFTNTGTLNLSGSGTIAGITNNAAGIVNLASSGTIASFNNATSTSTLNISALTVPTITTLTATTAGNTVNYNGAGAQAVKANSYDNLTLSGGSGIKTAGGVVTVNGTLSVGVGTTFSTANSVNAGGNWTVDGTFSQTAATTTFTGSVHSCSGAGSSQFAALVTSSQTFNAGSCDLRISGNWTHGTAGTFNEQTSTVTFNGTGAQTQPAIGFVPQLYNMTINNGVTGTMSSRVWTVTNNFVLTSGTFAPSATSSFKNFTISGGTFTAPAGNINVSGDWTNNGATFTPGTSTVTLNGSLSQSIGGTSATTFNNLTLNNSAGASLGANATVGATLTLTSGSLGVSTNTLTLNGTVACGANVISSSATGTVSYAQTSAGQNVCAGSYGNLTFSSFNKTLASSGTVSIAGTFTSGSATGHTVTNSTVDFNGAGAQTIPAFTFNNLTTSNGGTKTLGGAVTANGAVTLGASTTLDVSASNYALNVAGDWTNNGTFTQRSGTVTLNGAAQTVGGSSATTFYNLTLSGSGAKTLPADTSISNNLSIQPTGTATANLAAGVNYTVNSLTLGGFGKINETWGSTSSPAANQDNVYFAATSGYVTVSTDGRLTQSTLTAIATPSTVVYGSTSTLSFSGGNGTGALTYSEGTSTGCSVSGTTLSVTDASGTCNDVTVSKAGDGNYKPATSSAITVTLQKAATTTTVTGGTFTYDGTAHAATVSVTGAGGLNQTPAPTYSGSCSSSAPTTVAEGTTCMASYTFASTNNYLGSADSKSVTITAKALTMSGLSVPASKVYDGTTNAVVTDASILLTAIAPGTGTSSDGKPYTSDTINFTGTAVGTYNSKDVATASTVTFSGLSVDNTNYTLTIQGTASATITTKALTMSGLSVPASKIYDGTTNAVVTNASTLLTAITPGAGTSSDGKPYTGDTINFTSTALGTYDSKDVDTATTVTFSGLSVDNTNYTLTIQGTASATITTKALTMSGLSVPASKVYDGTTDVVLTDASALLTAITPGTGTSSDGKPYTGDTINFAGTAVGTYDSKDVATATTITFSGLSVDNTNYTLTIQGTAPATITAKALTMSGLSVPASKVYDGTTNAVVTDASALLTAITPGTGTSSDGKPYSIDSVSITGSATGTYNSKDVATAATVAYGGLSLTGTGSGNYTLTMQADDPATITAKALTMSGLSVPTSKVYDGTTDAVVTDASALLTAITPGTGTSSDGKPYIGDTVNFSGIAVGTYDSKDVATATTVTFSGLSLSNTNYTLTIQGTVSATITAKALTMSGLSVPASKVYDGTTNAVLTDASALASAEAPGAGTSSDGLPYTGDLIHFTGSSVGTYDSKDVASATTVTFTGLGVDNTNYSLTMQGSAPATITAKALTMSGLSVPASKVYDGTTNAVVTDASTLLAAITPGTGTSSDGKPYIGDTINFTGTAVGTYDSKDVATATTVTFSGLSVDNTNYSLTIQANDPATITAKALTMSGLSVPASKVYDGTTNAVVTDASTLLTAITSGTGTSSDGKPYTGDLINFTGTAVGTYDSKDVATATTVTFSGLSLSNTNYTLTMQGSASATITAKALTMSGLSIPASKVYDGTTNAVLTDASALASAEAPGAGTSSDGLPYTGDTINFTGSSVGTYDSKDVATATTVTFSGLSLDNTNYSLTMQGTVSATITAKALTMSGLSVPASKVYDGTTNAVVSGTPALATTEAVGAGTTTDGIPYNIDTVNITGTAVGTYDSKDVATATSVTFSGLSVDNTNYTLTMQGSASATITAKALTMSGLSVPASKVYDGTTNAVVSGTPVLATAEAVGTGTTTDGIPYNIDTVNITGTAVGTYDSKDVATASTVTFSGLSLDNTNYTLTIQSTAPATITPATPVISWSSPTAIDYGTALSGTQLNASTTPSGTFAYTPASGAVLSAGLAQTLKVDFTSTDTNYINVLNTTVLIDVNKKAASVTAVDNSKVIGTSDPALTTTDSGFLAGDLGAGKITFSASRALGEAINTYDITPAADDNLTGLLGNYTVTLNHGTFTIADKLNQSAITVVATPNPVAYGDTSTLSITGGDGTGAVTFDKGSSTGCSVSGAILTVTDVSGSCAISATKAADSNYFSATSATATTVTLTKATLTVTASNQSIPFGSADPAFTFGYSGFFNSEGAGALTTAPICSVSGIHTAVGSYDIICSGGVATNYNFNYVKGTLTVNAVNNPPTNVLLSSSNIDEIQPVGTLIGTLSTVDPDLSDTFTYSFCGGADDASFAISGNNLQSAVIFDYETKNSYSICVRSTDNGTLSTTKTFTITINNVVEQVFADVSITYWANSFIERLYNAGITGGCSAVPLNYCPEASVTRAQMAIFLLRGIHGSSYSPPAVGSDTGFTDVPVGAFADAWIKELSAEGITGGCGNGKYCPNTAVTRAQMAIFLLRAEHGASFVPPAASGIFTDVPATNFAIDWIEQLSAEGITGGCGVNLYCPNNPVTRAQMAVFLVKTFNLP